MQLIISANELQKEELSLKKVSPGVDVIYIEDDANFPDYSIADAVLILNRGITGVELQNIGNKIVFVNSVTATLSKMDTPRNVCRVNGWRTFLDNDVWEVAATDHQIVKELFSRIGWRCILVADEPGLVSARVIAMIINEAYFD
jgi:3-hydroxybutyryl-CoA dehydrogenase